MSIGDAWSWITTHPDTLINFLVAVGTLSLAAITVYQMRAGVAREMADLVYGPLLPWIALTTQPQWATRSEFIAEWGQIKQRHPYLSHRISKSLFASLEKLHRQHAILNGGLHGRTLNLERAALNQAAATIATQYKNGRTGDGDLWIAGEVLGPNRVNLLALWLSSQSLREFAETEAQRTHDPAWYVETRVAGFGLSKDFLDAERCSQAVFNAMDIDPVARDLKTTASEIVRLSRDIAPKVEKKVGTRFASRGKTDRVP